MARRTNRGKDKLLRNLTNRRESSAISTNSGWNFRRTDSEAFAMTLKQKKEAFFPFFKSSIFLLIKYTRLEQMSRKISQINFSFIQHLYVGDDLYITD